MNRENNLIFFCPCIVIIQISEFNVQLIVAEVVLTGTVGVGELVGVAVTVVVTEFCPEYTKFRINNFSSADELLFTFNSSL